mmetsp:Transcript_23088/g.64121  ORF Transcript_23088/g.64121 Transcript_23088/m.64121 type:complete len:399 (-) Transcript_23088:756-1952(-)
MAQAAHPDMSQHIGSLDVDMMNRLLDTSTVDSSFDTFSPRSPQGAAEIQRAAVVTPMHSSNTAPAQTPEHRATSGLPSSVYSTPRHLRAASSQRLFIGFDSEWELDVCAICLCQVESLEEAGRLPCSCVAVYHRDCIARWLLKNDSCPQCRESATAADAMTGSDAGCSKQKAQAQFERRKSGSGHSSKSCAGFEFEDVAVMYHCAPPFQQSVDMMYLLERHSPHISRSGREPAEVWMRLQGSHSAVVAITQPEYSTEAMASLSRGLSALHCVWMCSHGPSLNSMAYPECLQTQEYTATTGVAWRILDTDEPMLDPPYFIQKLFVICVRAYQAIRKFSRWFKCISMNRAMMYMVVIVLVMMSLLLGLHQICYEGSNGSRECTWGYEDTLMRRAIFYTSY